MNEIICPHCNKVFKVDEAGYTNRLANAAVELGGNDGSLLYETGAREAEKAAALLTTILKSKNGELRDASLEELSTFIQEHVHPEYQLASMVRQGVAYHYGHMPSLLREASPVIPLHPPGLGRDAHADHACTSSEQVSVPCVGHQPIWWTLRVEASARADGPNANPARRLVERYP